MGPKRFWFSGVEDVELIFPKYDYRNNYLVHNCYSNFPKFLDQYNFDGIIMMSTFMDKVTSYGLDSKWIKQFKFLKNSAAIKIVFSQDDYNFSEIRDNFYTKYNINKVLPVVSEKFWKELIPSFIAKGGEVEQGFTTYITPKIISLLKYRKDFLKRKYDVVYRAKKNPSTPNYFGYIKGIIGDQFIEKSKNYNLKLNISTNPKKLIRGDKWYRFLSESKSILGSNSGSSVRLKNKQDLIQINKFKENNPDANFFKIYKDAIKVEDRDKEYTCLSPRNIEAGIIGTLQILVKGKYSGILKPYDDYIPLEENCKNIDQIINILKDEESCKKIIENCSNKLLNEKSLDYLNLIQKNLEYIRTKKVIHKKNPFIRSFIFFVYQIYSKFYSSIKELIIYIIEFVR